MMAPEIIDCGNLQMVYLRLGMTASYLIKGDKIVIVDTGNKGDGNKILAALDKLGIKHGDVSLILLTHSHPDHAGSAAFLKQKLGVPVAVHMRDAGSLKKGEFHAVPRSSFGKILNIFSKSRIVDGCEPDIYVEDGMSLRDYGVDARIIHTPGHTPGSISILLSSGEAIVGDLVFGRLPFARSKPADPMFCDNPEQAIESMAKLLSYSPTRIYIAHGGPFEPDEIVKYFGLDASNRMRNTSP